VDSSLSRKTTWEVPEVHGSHGTKCGFEEKSRAVRWARDGCYGKLAEGEGVWRDVQREAELANSAEQQPTSLRRFLLIDEIRMPEIRPLVGVIMEAPVGLDKIAPSG